MNNKPTFRQWVAAQPPAKVINHSTWESCAFGVYLSEHHGFNRYECNVESFLDQMLGGCYENPIVTFLVHNDPDIDPEFADIIELKLSTYGHHLENYGQLDDFLNS